jgi:hypothetical protein
MPPEDPRPAKAENETLELVHHHPGRLRVRAEAFRRDPEVVLRVRGVVEALPGITRFAHAARTGSLLVEYEPGLTEPDVIIEQIADTADLGLPVERAARSERRAPALVAVGAARELNALSLELTGSRVDLRVLVPTALAAMSAYSFVYQKGARLPRWDNLLYWSYNIFVSLHRREIEGGGVAPGGVRLAKVLRPVPLGDPSP